MKRRWWRLGLRVIAHLGAGVLISLAVAWGSVLVAGAQHRLEFFVVGAVSPYGEIELNVRHEHSWAADRYFSFLGDVLSLGPPVSKEPDRIVLPRWAVEVIHDRPLRGVGPDLPGVEARGWPARMLMVELELVPSRRVVFGKEVSIGWVRSHESRLVAVVFPLKPIPAGVAANAAVYAAAVFLSASGISALRRRVRRRNGQCVACGYDLRGSVDGVCPECGGAS